MNEVKHKHIIYSHTANEKLQNQFCEREALKFRNEETSRIKTKLKFRRIVGIKILLLNLSEH